MPAGLGWLDSEASLNGRVVLITGAGSGIGAASALELLSRGAVPVLVDCDGVALDRVCAAGGDLLKIQADVTVLAECQAVVATVQRRYGRIDVVWANAGIASFGPLAHTDPEAWRRCIEVDATAPSTQSERPCPTSLPVKVWW